MTDNDWLMLAVQELDKSIFGAELRRLRKAELDLVHQNNRLCGKMDGFFYKDTLYSELDPSIKYRGTKGNLHHSLQEAVENHYRDENEIKFDRIRVKQALVLILRDCRTWQDVRDALPNSLKDVLPIAARLDRTREEAYTVKDDPRAYRQYLQLRDKIEFYNAARLLY